MTLSKRIRAILSDGIPRSSVQLRETLGLPGKEVAQALGNMATRGLVVPDKSVYPAIYTLGRQLPAKLTKDELDERSRERRRRWARERGIKTRVEHLAMLAAQKSENDRLKALRTKKAEQARLAKMAATEHAAREKREQGRAVLMAKTSALVSKPVKESFPDTESFIRENPGLYQVLPAGVWANPVLRFEY